MGNKNRIWIVVVLFCCTLFGGYCMAGTANFTAVVDVVVPNRELLKDAVLELQIYKDGLNSRYIKDRQYSRTELVDSLTRFIIPLSSTINYGRVIFSSGELIESNSPVNLNYGNNLFLFEPGDTIQVHLYPKRTGNVVFTGNRASKFSALYQINSKKEIDVETLKLVNNLTERNEFRAAFDVLEEWADSLNNVFDQILTEFQPITNRRIIELAILDNRAFTYKVKRGVMERLIRAHEDNTELLQLIYSVLSERTFEQYSMLNEAAAAQSYGWCDMLVINEMVRSKVKHILENGSMPSGESVGYGVSERYSGQIRNKLFYLALLCDLDTDGVINKDLQYRFDGEDRYREAARHFLKRTERYPAFNFEMVDENGINHSLIDYNGRVVILDFWFSGCMACMYLTKEMHEAVKFFENSDDVIFISLNFDRNPNSWRRSLASGKYTHKSSLNLWSGEAAFNHPIIAYYGIQSYPTLFIIDKNGLLVEKYVNKLYHNSDPLATDKFKALVNKYR